MTMEHLGTLRKKVDIAAEFQKLAREDQQAAEVLAQAGMYRPACYCLLQAMEKTIRAKIFTLVNPNLEYFRNKNKTHSLAAAVDFLLEIITTNPVIKEQVGQQLFGYVLGKTNYALLNNSLRYPFYSPRFDSYSMLDFSAKDYAAMQHRAANLQHFLNDLHRLIG